MITSATKDPFSFERKLWPRARVELDTGYQLEIERDSGYHNSNLSKSITLCTSFALCRAANANCAKFKMEIMRLYYT